MEPDLAWPGLGVGASRTLGDERAPTEHADADGATSRPFKCGGGKRGKIDMGRQRDIGQGRRRWGDGPPMLVGVEEDAGSGALCGLGGSRMGAEDGSAGRGFVDHWR